MDRSVTAGVLTRPDTPMVGSVNGDGHLFTPAGEEVYEAHINNTWQHKEHMPAQGSKNLGLQVLADKQKAFMGEIKNIPGNSMLDEVD